ncbi:MAG: glycosyltransferase family 4 protein [Ardenticatenaceae bacterium]|nr:glycosyltransferase family 4 protein [Ardenticatenaceae bacterium]
MYQIGFIIEQVLGHVTHGKNLQQNIPSHPEIKARWALPTWQTTGLIAQIPVVKSNWTVHAGLQARQAIAQWQQQTPVDGLFFHTQVPAILAQNWMRHIPAIVSLDATPLQYDRLGEFYAHETGPSWLEQKKWQLNVSCYQKARHLVTWSDWAKQGLIDEYQVPPDKITVIPPGVNTAEWQRPFPTTHSANSPVKILFVGANLERKGGHILLEAFRQLRATTNIELHLVTKDTLPPEDGLTIYNNMQPNTPQLKQIFHQSDIFCLPTFGDCLPMVLAEAGAATLPLISTNVAAIPEIVRHQETGLVVPPQNVAALAEALQQLITNPDLRRSYGQNAQTIVQQHHDAPTNAARLITLLKQIIDEAKNNA